MFTKTYGRVLTPGLTDLSPALPGDLARRSPIAMAWQQLDRALDQHVTAGLAGWRLGRRRGLALGTRLSP